MGDFLGIMFSIMFFLTPKEIDRVQIWPYAADTNSHTRELSMTFQRTSTGWCPGFGETNSNRCIVLNNGKWMDENGKVLLDIKNNLKVTQATNYVFKAKEWENPLEFSVREGNGQRTFEIKNNGKTIRELKVKMFKSNEGGPANGSQPFRSETNSTSSAAGSRR